jgi:hypothetical protein
MREREVASLNLHVNLIQNDSENDRVMSMVMSSGWRVVPIIQKNILLFFGFFQFLICRVLFNTR